MEYVADLVIVLMLLSAVYVGIARGIWGPLITEGSFVVAFLIDINVLQPIVGTVIPAGFVRTGIGIVAVLVMTIVFRFLLRPLYYALQRLPITRHIDEPAGGLLHGFVGFAVLYLVLGVILDFDRNVYPTLSAGVATAQAINDYRQAIDQRPYLSGVVDQAKLKQIEQQALPKPIPSSALQGAERFLDFYVKNIREPLIGSRLAPIINKLGERLPIVGKPRPYIAGAKHS